MDHAAASVADEPGPRYITVSSDGAWQVHDTQRRETLPGRYDQATADRTADALNATPTTNPAESEPTR